MYSVFALLASSVSFLNASAFAVASAASCLNASVVVLTSVLNASWIAEISSAVPAASMLTIAASASFAIAAFRLSSFCSSTVAWMFSFAFALAALNSAAFETSFARSLTIPLAFSSAADTSASEVEPSINAYALSLISPFLAVTSASSDLISSRSLSTSLFAASFAFWSPSSGLAVPSVTFT